MERGKYSNFPEENNYSTILNEDITINDYSTSTRNNSLHQTNKYGNYNYSRMQPSSSTSHTGIYPSVDDASANIDARESLRQYIDQLTAHLYKYDPDSLRHLENNLSKFKNGDVDIYDAGRTTPLLFPEIHSLAKLDFPGLLYQLLPNALSQTGGFIRITDEIFPKYFQLNIDDYPGPLSIETTTEEQIFYYLKDQMSIELQDTSPLDSDSGQLLINYLELLIKENGRPRMSNVVRLLNEGIETKTSNLRKEFKPYDSVSRNSLSRTSSHATSLASSRAPSPENRETNIDPDLPQNSLDKPRGPGSVVSVIRSAANTVSNDQKLYQNMDKYREYIWSGRFEEAINFAMRAGIWDHAFALALRINNPALVNEILVRFSRRAIYDNDPLSTMHELMAARMPRVVASNRGFSDSEMGDWRSHLSMILAVKRFKPEESRLAIESMGDKLILLRSYFAAHLCYLLAGTPFGLDRTTQKFRRKFELIGWPMNTTGKQKSNNNQFSGLDYWRSAPEQFIKLTEVYEYVLKLRLDDSHRTLSVHLLPYKYIMAYRMLSTQRVRKAYDYCRNIGEVLGYSGIVDWLNCESVTFHMVSNIRDLSYRLHSLLNNSDDYEDNSNHNRDSNTAWLSNVDNVYCQFCSKLKLWNPNSDKLNFDALEAPIDTEEDSDYRYEEAPIKGNVVPDNTLYQYQSEQRQTFPNQQLPSQSQQLLSSRINQQPFYDIPPPLDLPSDVLMSSPYRRTGMRTVSGSSSLLDTKEQPYSVPNDYRHRIQPQTTVSNDSRNHQQQHIIPHDYRYQAQQPLVSNDVGHQQPEQLISKEKQSKQKTFPQNDYSNQSLKQAHVTNEYRYQPQQTTVVSNENPHQSLISKDYGHQSEQQKPTPNDNHYQPPLSSDYRNQPQQQPLVSNDNRHQSRVSNDYQSQPLQQPLVSDGNRHQPRIPNDYRNQPLQQTLGSNDYRHQEPQEISTVINSRPQFSPVLPHKSTDRFEFTNSSSPRLPPHPASMFVPSMDQDLRGSMESVDCFAITQPVSYSRSRSQSNCSASSGGGGGGGGDRRSRRNSSESKDPPKVPGGRTALESTTEEKEVVVPTKENEKKPSGWNPLQWFSKGKGAQLPDDRQNSIENDQKQKKWIDKSSSAAPEKPPTPPPKMFMSSSVPLGPVVAPQSLTLVNQYQPVAPNNSPHMTINANYDANVNMQYQGDGNNQYNYGYQTNSYYGNQQPLPYDRNSFYQNNYNHLNNQ